MLSFFSIFGIQNNINFDELLAQIVVNCFHFSVSLGYKTTVLLAPFLTSPLWIAFIFQYLWDTKQPITWNYNSTNGCELLSFFSIFGIQNNTLYIFVILFQVVNCFHFSVSLGYKTTIKLFHLEYMQLWIAFIFQYLWDTKQPTFITSVWFSSCELLSFFSIFGIQNNFHELHHFPRKVVNCFHFSVSLGYKTTSGEFSSTLESLWIAFIFQYLWDTKQHSSNL